MSKLLKLLHELESNISNCEALNLAISKSPVSWHIEHACLTINLIIDGLKKSDMNKYKWKFSLPKVLIFFVNKIPRGRAQAPASVQPKSIATMKTLQRQLITTKIKLAELHILKPNNYFEHPVFGKLNLKPTIQFLEIHTMHHIAIINDIINANNKLV